jgi:hypothetical protein
MEEAAEDAGGAATDGPAEPTDNVTAEADTGDSEQQAA